MFTLLKKKNSNFIYFLFLSALNLLFFKIIFYTIGDLSSVNAGEFRNPRFPEIIFNKGLSLWDESFGFGFNNMYGENKPEYAIGQPIWIFNNFLDFIFNKISGIFLTTQFVSLLVLNLTIYKLLNIFGKNLSKIQSFVFVFSTSIILYFSAISFSVITSGAKYLLWQSFVLLSLLLFKEVLNENKNYKVALLYLFSSLYVLSLFFPPFFVVISIYIFLYLIIYISINLFNGNDVDKKKLFLIFLALSVTIIFGQSLSLVPILFESENINLVLARHNIPLSLSTGQILNLFHNVNPLITISWYLLIVIGFFNYFKNFKNRIDLFLFLIFLFLSHGSYSFFSNINIFIHQEIPFFKFLGSTYPYTSITASFLVIFFILGINYVINYFKLNLHKKYFLFFFLSLVIIFLAFNTNLKLSNINHKISSINFPKDYYDFKFKAEQINLNSRMYYFPDNRSIVPTSYEYSDSTYYCCYSLPFTNNFPIDIKWSNYNDWTGSYSSYASFYNRNIKNTNDLIFFMYLSNTSHLIFDLNIKKDSKGYYRLKNILNLISSSNLFKIDYSLSNKTIQAYKLKVNNNFFDKKKINLISPNLKAVRSTFDSKKLINPFIFSKNLSINSFYKLIDNNLLDKIIGLNYDAHSIFLDLISSDYMLEPKNYKQLGAHNNWSYLNQYYQDEYVVKNSGNIFLNNKPLFSNNTSKPIIYNIDNYNNEEGYFFVRAYISPNSGELLVKNNNSIKKISLKSKKYEGFKWFKFQSLNNKSFEISVNDKSKFYIVDSVLFITKKEYENKLIIYQNTIKDLQQVFNNDSKYDDWLTKNESRAYNSKKILITNEFFKFNDNFDIFNDSILAYGATIVNDPDSKNLPFEREYNSAINGNFLRTVDNQTSELIMNLYSNDGFNNLTLSIETIGFYSKLPIYIEVYNDDYNVKFNLIEDKKHILKIPKELYDQNNLSVRIFTSNFVEGKVAYIKNIEIEGQSNFIDKDTPFNFVENIPLKNENLIIFDVSYDHNWQFGNSDLLNMNLGNIGFLCTSDCKQNLSHKYTSIYKVLVFLNFLLITFVSIILFFILLFRKKII